MASLLAPQWKSTSRGYFQQLKRKLRWQMLLVYMTPLVLLAVYFHYQYNATLRKGINNHLKSIAESQRNTVDLFLEERIVNLRNAFGSIPEQGPLPSLDLETVLKDLQAESATFVDVGLFEQGGTQVAYAGPYPNLQGTDYSGESWWHRLDSGDSDVLISDVYMGFRGRPHFIIAVKRSIHDRMWVLRASVDPERFARFVGRSHLTEEARTFIVNGSGKLQTIRGEQQDRLALDSVPPRSSETRVIRFHRNAEKFVGACAWLRQNDWVLVVSAPESRVYAPLLRVGLVLAGIMLVTLLVTVLLIFRSTSALVGRLQKADESRERLRGQLFNAAKLASVGEMAAGVAHEINNPLAIIYEEAAIMRDMLDPAFKEQMQPDEIEERLQAIGDAAMRGRSITSKLMAFSRKHEPFLEPTSLNEEVEKVLAMKTEEFRVNDIQVIRELEAGLPELRLNRNQLEQVLLNLLNNARDAMNGPGTITIRTRYDNAHVQLEIQDTGRGMTDEQMEQVFFPFYTTKGVGKGTGLGLSISYGIIKSFGGRIEVESEVGRGTTFTIMIPVGRRIEKISGTTGTERGTHE